MLYWCYQKEKEKREKEEKMCKCATCGKEVQTYYKWILGAVQSEGEVMVAANKVKNDTHHATTGVTICEICGNDAMFTLEELVEGLL